MFGPSYSQQYYRTWNPNLPPEEPSPQDDEFITEGQLDISGGQIGRPYSGGASLDRSKWQIYDPNSLLIFREIQFGLGTSINTRTGNNISIMYQSFPGHTYFAIGARVFVNAGFNAGGAIGIGIFENAPGNAKITSYALYADMSIKCQNWSNINTIAATVATTMSNLGGHSLYLLFQRTGTTQCCWFSQDGLNFQNSTWVTSPYVTSPLHMGLVFINNNITYGCGGAVQFFRYYPYYIGDRSIPGRFQNIPLDTVRG